MLWRTLQANNGEIPAECVVAFANTGREMPATLDFVQRCGAEWSVPIRWLEYRHQPDAEDRHGFEEVSHNSASRNGEPFEQVIRARRGTLPNPRMRYCTVELKIRTMRRFIKAEFGWTRWAQMVGLRADEPKRVETATDPAKQTRNGEPGRVFCPLSDAGVQEIDVLQFWRAQPFDLALKGPWEGNCDGCFLKNRGGISRMCQDHPERMQWWADTETARAGRSPFRDDREGYARLLEITQDQGVLPFDLEDGLTCGVGCTG